MTAKQVQLRRGTQQEHQSFIGAQAELTVDTTTWTLRLHDGITAGGRAIGTNAGAISSGVLDIAFGGTGASSSTGARQNLGLVNENFDLTAFLSVTSNGLLVRTGTNGVAVRAISGTTNQINVANGDGVLGSPTIGISESLVLPGQIGTVLASGTTAQRIGTPSAGLFRFNSTTTKLEYFNGSNWHLVSSLEDGASPPTVSHASLTGLDADDHTQYLLVNGTRGMTGSLDMGGQSITNVSMVDGIDVTAHASRHLPNGLDPLATESAVALSTTSPNAEGTSNAFARSDHTHELLDVQPESAELTAVSSIATTGAVYRTGAATYTTRAVEGTTDQVAVNNGDGINGNPVIALAPNVVLPGDQYMIVPIGTTASRPLAPINGMLRYNTDSRHFEFYQDGSWVPYVTATGGGGAARASWSANIPATTGTEIIPYDDTAPEITEGKELFTKTVYPSTIYSSYQIQFSFTFDASANNRNVICAVFRENVCISTTTMNTATSGKMYIFSVHVTDKPNTTLPVTYSVRFGGEMTMTWNINNSSTPLFAGTMAGNGWKITENS